MCFPDTNWEQLSATLQIEPQAAELAALGQRHWILAFSAGADSVLSLFFLLQFLSHHGCRQLTLFYLDHGQKFSAESQQEREAVFAWARQTLGQSGLNWQWHQEKCDVARVARFLKTSFEAAGSRLRKRRLGRLAKNDAVLVFGHTLSDWYETLQMRLQRGSSQAAFFPFAVMETGKTAEVRPLALLFRHEVREMAGRHHLPWWNDPSNQDLSIERNFVRHHCQIYRPEGLRRTALNLLSEKAAGQGKNIEFLPVHERELRYDYQNWLHQPEPQQILQAGLKKLGLWPLSFHIQQKLARLPFYHGPWAIERENWGGQLFLVFRRGRLHLPGNRQPADTVRGDLARAFFIRQSYGRKSVKKVFSEKKLSARQQKNLFLTRGQANEAVLIPLSVFGLPDLVAKTAQGLQQRTY